MPKRRSKMSKSDVTASANTRMSAKEQLLNEIEHAPDAINHDHYLYGAPKVEEWELSFCIMQQQNLLEALAYDKHFEQAGFIALLR